MAKVECGNPDPRTNAFTASMYRRCSVDNAGAVPRPCSRCGSGSSQFANGFSGDDVRHTPKPSLDELFRASSWNPPLVPAAGVDSGPALAPLLSPRGATPDAEGLFRASTLRPASATSVEEAGSGSGGGVSGEERTSSAGSRRRSRQFASQLTGMLTDMSTLGKNLKRKVSKHKIREYSGPLDPSHAAAGTGAGPGAGPLPLGVAAYPRQLLPSDYDPHRVPVTSSAKEFSRGIVTGEVDTGAAAEETLRVTELSGSESDDDGK